jgi:high-affinity iron transporter
MLIYVYAVRLNLSLFFDFTSFFLIIFAAGLLAHGIHEYQEIGALPILTGIAWDTRALLDSESTLGSILASLVGYSDQPSVLQVAVYIGYWVVILQGIRWWTHRLGTQLVQRHT